MVNGPGLRGQIVANADADANDKYNQDICIDHNVGKSFEPY